MANNYVTQNSIKIEISTMPGDWDKGSAPTITHNNTRHRATAQGPELVFRGKSTKENITTEKFVDPVRDASLLQRLRDGELFEDTTLKYIYMDQSGVRVGTPEVYPGCCVEKVTFVEADANGEDPVKLIIEWMVP